MELSNKKKLYLDTFINNFSIKKRENILEFGKIIENRISSINSVVFSKSMKQNNNEIEKTISDIINEINKMNSNNKKTPWYRRLFKTKEMVEKPDYSLILKSIDILVIELKKHMLTLQKDLNMIKLLDENNSEYLHEIDMYLLAGKLVLEKANDEAFKLKSENKDLEYNDYVNSINNFEKRLHDLELARMICIQLHPQINLVENNNYLIIDRINFLINSTIPLLKSEILIMINNEKGEEFAKTSKEVSELMNQILLSNSESLKGMREKVKEELKNGDVTSLSLLETTKLITASLNEITSINNKENNEELEDGITALVL